MECSFFSFTTTFAFIYLVSCFNLYFFFTFPVSDDDICSVKSIEVVEEIYKGDIYYQSDGEHLGFLPGKCSILPAAIDFFC